MSSTFSFATESKRVAALTITGTSARRILSSAPSAGPDSPLAHVLGAFGSPRFRLVEPQTPSGAWTIATVAGAPGISRRVPEDVRTAYEAWAAGTAAENGAHVLGALPNGSYLLVRSRPPRERAREMRLGDVRAPAPENVSVWGSSPSGELGAYVAAFGRAADAAASFKTPYVGLAVLNFGANGVRHALLSFELADPGTVSQLVPASPDAVIIVPVTAPLIVDTLARASAERAAEELLAWQTTHARALVEFLSGPNSAPNVESSST